MAELERTLLRVHLVPGADRDALVCWQEGEVLRIKVRARPIEGKANSALLRFLSEQLDIPQSRLQIQRGDRSRTKQVQVDGLTLDGIRRRLKVDRDS